ncbi:NADH dehydrogenase (ubiquinone), J subunit [Pseudogulbenkiania sp. NH8B]|uniref:NADH-quinone oxidoreductase subunit J n=2 Tax=Pseudogulbenkiania TaxID=568394 RepID=A0A1Y6BC44_9NEIS|nr:MULTISPECIES: NADH-quinone oxidoreductase subunit J [Pseudogulbenkiania]EEG09483.1 NADH-ubiquinone/plastoquinone oxidoreductase chain 6 [Pseudogulbenkiania ferrooxidans 2002]BAK75458.1 NADH dehydrogenase (ubiquinone), J subunit [Pseudogulbenkiania sp. NH8B]SME96440.1 NADH dehydrogenase subunit J [Pseudogulbenkiania subflava DSM 22618]
MSFPTVVFYVLSAILIFAGLRVITAKNPVHAALYLVLAFFTSAGHWLLLESEFLAISLVLVYVGAVMVLFLFVVMMLDINFEKLREGFWKNAPLAGTVGLIMVGEMVLILMSPEASLGSYKGAAPLAADASNIRELGRLIYTTYLWPFELAAVVLLVGMVAAIALTMRKRKDTKFVNPGDQVVVRRDDRVRLVKMAAVKRSEPVAEAESADQQA